MSVVDKVLKDFISISDKFSENISIYYTLNCNESLGISYFELNKVSNDLSQYFSNLLGEKSHYVGVSLSDYFLLPCLILGIWKSKNCFAGLGTQYTRNNTINFLHFLSVKYVITDTDRNEYGGKLISQFSIHCQKFFVWCRQTEGEVNDLEGICYGIMTSGSTGDPKIIQVPWSCILPNVMELSSEFEVTELDCIFLASPYSFDPFFIELLMAFFSGSTLMIVSYAVKLCPSDLLNILFLSEGNVISDSPMTRPCLTETEKHFQIEVLNVKKRNVSILQMTPSVFKRWSESQIKNVILSPKTSLRRLILGGEKFPKEILKLKHPDNKTKIYNIYGITEISCWAFCNEVPSTINCHSDSEISIGKPLNNIVYRILKNGEFEIGSSDRICLVNKEQTSHSQNPVYRGTGDIVRLSNSEIYYMGRTSQMVKKYGMKISLSKIENAFMKENKLINKCFCIYDEENLKLGLFYVPAVAKPKETNYKLVTVEEFLKSGYKIPIDTIKSVEKPDYLLEITQTPLNLHGKCDKQQLLQYLRDIYITEEHNSVNIVFKKLWVEVLGNTQNLTSMSFIELGGNSVLALDLINKLEDRGFRVPQNFIAELLGGKCYESCLECLSLAQEEFTIPRKRIKLNAENDKVKLSEIWKFDLGKCVDAPGVIFAYKGEERLVIGSHSSKLSCINPDSGCEIWSSFLGDRIESGFRPTKDGSRGFVGCYDHCVYCIAASDGRVIWKFKTGDAVKSTPCLSSDENIVYVASYDKILYCLSVADGTPKKSLKLSNGGIRCPGIASDAFNTFFIGTLEGTCLAINQDTNEPIWKTTLESPVFAGPCLIPNKPEILFSEVLGYVHCLNVFNGDKVWTFKAGGNIYSSPSVKDVNGIHHIIFGCHDAYLYCLQYEKEVELKWKQQLDSSVFATPLIVMDYSSICAVTTKGFVYLCDFFVGSVQTQLKLAGELFSSAVYLKNRLFLGCRDNNVYSLEISKLKDAEPS